ncbi:MAG: DUF2341 domain-containing protein, partial [Candidatus Thorarchaeota archaeon]
MISDKKSKKEYEEELEKYVTPISTKRASYRIPQTKVHYNLSEFNFEELDEEIEELAFRPSHIVEKHSSIQEGYIKPLINLKSENVEEKKFKEPTPERIPCNINVKHSLSICLLSLLAIFIITAPFILLIVTFLFTDVAVNNFIYLLFLSTFVVMLLVCSFGGISFYFTIVQKNKKEYFNRSWIKASVLYLKQNEKFQRFICTLRLTMKISLCTGFSVLYLISFTFSVPEVYLVLVVLLDIVFYEYFLISHSLKNEISTLSRQILAVLCTIAVIFIGVVSFFEEDLQLFLTVLPVCVIVLSIVYKFNIFERCGAILSKAISRIKLWTYFDALKHVLKVLKLLSTIGIVIMGVMFIIYLFNTVITVEIINSSVILIRHIIIGATVVLPIPFLYLLIRQLSEKKIQSHLTLSTVILSIFLVMGILIFFLNFLVAGIVLFCGLALFIKIFRPNADFRVFLISTTLILFPMGMAWTQVSLESTLCPVPSFALVDQQDRIEGVAVDFKKLEYKQNISTLKDITFNSMLAIKVKMSVSGNQELSFVAKLTPKDPRKLASKSTEAKQFTKVHTLGLGSVRGPLPLDEIYLTLTLDQSTTPILPGEYTLEIFYIKQHHLIVGRVSTVHTYSVAIEKDKLRFNPEYPDDPQLPSGRGSIFTVKNDETLAYDNFFLTRMEDSLGKPVSGEISLYLTERQGFKRIFKKLCDYEVGNDGIISYMSSTTSTFREYMRGKIEFDGSQSLWYRDCSHLEDCEISVNKFIHTADYIDLPEFTYNGTNFLEYNKNDFRKTSHLLYTHDFNIDEIQWTKTPSYTFDNGPPDIIYLNIDDDLTTTLESPLLMYIGTVADIATFTYKFDVVKTIIGQEEIDGIDVQIKTQVLRDGTLVYEECNFDDYYNDGDFSWKTINMDLTSNFTEGGTEFKFKIIAELTFDPGCDDEIILKWDFAKLEAFYELTYYRGFDLENGFNEFAAPTMGTAEAYYYDLNNPMTVGREIISSTSYPGLVSNNRFDSDFRVSNSWNTHSGVFSTDDQGNPIFLIDNDINMPPTWRSINENGLAVFDLQGVTPIITISDTFESKIYDEFTSMGDSDRTLKDIRQSYIVPKIVSNQDQIIVVFAARYTTDDMWKLYITHAYRPDGDFSDPIRVYDPGDDALYQLAPAIALSSTDLYITWQQRNRITHADGETEWNIILARYRLSDFTLQDVINVTTFESANINSTALMRPTIALTPIKNIYDSNGEVIIQDCEVHIAYENATWVNTVPGSRGNDDVCDIKKYVYYTHLGSSNSAVSFSSPVMINDVAGNSINSIGKLVAPKTNSLFTYNITRLYENSTEILFSLFDGKYYKKITIDGAKVEGTLTNFPMLVSFTDSDLINKTQPDGGDIYFTKANQITKLAHEIEYFNSTTGELIAWIKIPTLSGSKDTIIYMYYGNQFCPNHQNPKVVWDSSYQGVYHLQETSGSHYDSTTYDRDGTNYGSTQDVAGKIGKANSFDGTDDYIDITGWKGIGGSTKRTITAWIKSSFTDTQGIVGWGSSVNAGLRWRFLIDGNNNDALRTDVHMGMEYANTDVTTGSWVYVACVLDGNKIEDVIHYVNGADDGTAEYTSQTVNTDITTNTVKIGAQHTGTLNFNGYIDEVRISNVARSGGWINTSYQNQNNPSTFYSIGIECNASYEKRIFEVSSLAVSDRCGQETVLFASESDYVKKFGQNSIQLKDNILIFPDDQQFYDFYDPRPYGYDRCVLEENTTVYSLKSFLSVNVSTIIKIKDIYLSTEAPVDFNVEADGVRVNRNNYTIVGQFGTEDLNISFANNITGYQYYFVKFTQDEYTLPSNVTARISTIKNELAFTFKRVSPDSGAQVYLDVSNKLFQFQEDLLVSGQINWTEQFDDLKRWDLDESGGTITVNTAVGGHTNVAQMYKNSVAAKNLIMKKPINQMPEGKLEFWWRVSATTRRTHFMLYDGSTSNAVQLSLDSTNQLQYNDGTWHNIFAYSANTWYRFEIEYDCDSDWHLAVYDANNNYKGGDGGNGYSFKGSPEAMDTIYFAAGKYFYNYYSYVDDLSFAWNSTATSRYLGTCDVTYDFQNNLHVIYSKEDLSVNSTNLLFKHTIFNASSGLFDDANVIADPVDLSNYAYFYMTSPIVNLGFNNTLFLAYETNYKEIGEADQWKVQYCYYDYIKKEVIGPFFVKSGTTEEHNPDS